MKGLIALAFGALGFGVGEFVAMGLLPYFAHDFDLDIATAGHSISAYALGVCVGIVYMMFTRKLNLKVSILIVVSCYTVGMVLTAVAQSFAVVLLARFISGLPHGCFFGLGAIIAMRISAAGKGSSAMALMLAGQTTSIVCGVPLGMVAPILIAMGVAMTVYNLISGRLADKYSPGKVTFWIFLSCIAALLAAYFWGDIMIVGIVLMTYASGCLFGLGGPQQVSILRTSPGGELIGVAFGQVAFNFGNAIGAFLGGVPLELGYGPESVLLVSAGLAVVGTLFMLAYILLSEQSFTERFFAAQAQRLAAAHQEAQAEVVAAEAARQADHASEVAQVSAEQARVSK